MSVISKPSQIFFKVTIPGFLLSPFIEKQEEARLKSKHKRALISAKLFSFVIAVVVAVGSFCPTVIVPFMKSNVNYDKAVELFDSGKFDEAYDIASKIKKEDAAELTVRILSARQKSLLEDIEIGDVINFGFSVIDDKRGTDTQEMNWLVLDIVDGKALIITNTYFDLGTNTFNGLSWKESEGRTYLNNDFLEKYFLDEQKDLISLTDVPVDEKFDEYEYEYTTDRVFLLSVDEINHYFPNEEDRVFKNQNDQNVAWLLRSRNAYDDDIIGIDEDGVMDYYYRPNNGMFRPAMWIDISNID